MLQEGRVGLFKTLLTIAINRISFTALHLAALHGHENVIDYLLREDVTFVEDALGLSPLDYAKKGKNLAIVKKLENKTLTSNGNSDDA